jgi:transcriptional antiterminator RfaH
MHMDYLRDNNWFAVHVKRFRESLAAHGVRELGLDVFLPIVKVERVEHDGIRVGKQPLFPGYFFARFIPEVSLQAVESSRGVLRVIKSGTYPIPVDDEAVHEIQNRLAADGFLRLQHRELKPGDRISIQEGPFAGMMGRVEAELDDRRRVAILLETLWHARVVIEKLWVEAEAA